MRLFDLAARIGGTVDGDGAVEVTRGASLEEAGPGDLTFLASRKHAAKARATKASAIVLGPKDERGAIPAVRAPDAYLAFARALEVLHPAAPPPAGVHATAVVNPTAELGEGVHVGALAVVGPHVRLGACPLKVEHRAPVGAAS